MIANSTPLIYLAKLGKLKLLKKLFNKIYIPEEAKKEVVDQGKQLNEPDAYIVEKAISEGWIIIEKAEIIVELEKTGIDRGELEAISLAVKKKDEILLDQTHARIAGELVGLKPKGTLYILFLALKEKEISYDEYLILLQDLARFGFRMSQEIYIEAIKIGKEFAEKNIKIRRK